jgi:branched-chain amino acid transport system permease protein
MLANYRGVPVRAGEATAWAWSAGLATLAGVAYMYITLQLVPPTLPDLGLLVFPAVILGGIDSLAGVILGSFAFALIETLTSRYIGGDWVNVVGYGLVLALLLVRPWGILGSKEVVRL